MSSLQPETVLGESALFRFVNENPDLALSLRERRILVGALNFHALMAPERELAVHLYDGGWADLPRTTDDSTFTGLSRAYRSRRGTIRIRSVVPAEARESSLAEAATRALVDRPSRHIQVPGDEVLDLDPPRDISMDPVRRALRAVRARMPLLYDDARDIELLRHRRPLHSAMPRRQYEREFEAGGIHAGSEIIPASSAPSDAIPAVIIALHWFELGGAERWAFETVRLVREAGLLPIVLSNRDSHHPWITRRELDGAVLLPFSEPTSTSQTSGVEEVLRAIMRTFDVRGVVVHHNQWMYDRLHWLRRSRPDLPIVDSTHIVEYRGGGYPVSSVLVEEAITAHHVISPALERFLVGVQQVDASKVVMAPLGALTVDIDDPEFRERGDGEPLVVAFVGRLARQKAPEVFVSMVARLAHRTDIRFVMHGDGDMASVVDRIIVSRGVADRIERADSSVPVAQTLERAHLLVVPSHNEGLTLTTLEAIAHGVPVVSTDVGSQRDIVPARALVPREAHLATRGLARIVEELADDEVARRRLWQQEREAERTLLSHTSASAWFAQEVSTW